MNPLQAFVKKCVSNHATYDQSEGFHILDVSDLPDFMQHEFAARIMSHDNKWASEALGADNPAWEHKMLPMLLCYMKNSTDREEGQDFNKTFIQGVTEYMKDHMQQLINEELISF